jgi:Flp pilus assembly pilin Flp
MSKMLWKLYVTFQTLSTNEEAQDLVEYALLCSLIALSLIAGISSIASAVNKVFSNVSTSLA